MRTWAVLVRISWNQHWFPDQWTRAQRALGPHIRSLGEERDEWTSCPVNVLHQAEPRPLPPSREKATFPSLLAVNTFPRFLIKPRHLLPRTNLSDLWKSITSPCYFSCLMSVIPLLLKKRHLFPRLHPSSLAYVLGLSHSQAVAIGVLWPTPLTPQWL